MVALGGLTVIPKTFAHFLLICIGACSHVVVRIFYSFRNHAIGYTLRLLGWALMT